MKKTLLVLFLSIISVKAQTVTDFVTGLNSPISVAFDNSGNAFVTEAGSYALIKIDPSLNNSVITNGFLGSPNQLAIDSSNDFWVSCTGRISQVTQAGVITNYSNPNTPYGIAIDNDGNIFYSETATGNIIKRTESGIVSTFATGLSSPNGLTIDTSGNLIVAETGTDKILKITPAGIVSDLITNIYGPRHVVCNSNGDLYISTGYLNKIYRLASGQSDGAQTIFISNFNGNGMAIYNNELYIVKSNDNKIVKVSILNNQSADTYVQGLNNPIGVTFANSNLYVSQSGNNIISKINSPTSVETYQTLNSIPNQIIYKNNFWISSNNNIRKINNNVIDDYPNSNIPAGITVDPNGNTYYSESVTGNIIRITNTGIESIFVSGLNSPSGLTIDNSFNLIVAETGSGKVKKISILGNVVVSDLITNIQGVKYVVYNTNGDAYFSTGNSGKIFKLNAGDNDGQQILFKTGVEYHGMAIYNNELYCATGLNNTIDKFNLAPIPSGNMIWTSVNIDSNTAGKSFESVAFGNGLFVATNVGISGSKIYTSSNGINWIARTTPDENLKWSSIAFGNGIFVAVGPNSNFIMTSIDGINWSLQANPFLGTNWYNVSFCNGKFFVSGGNSPDQNNIMTSTDGINWTASSFPSFANGTVVFGNNKYVALSISGASENIATSNDGINWTFSSGPDNIWTSLTFGNGKFVAVAYTGNGDGKRVMYSLDGLNWTTSLSSEEHAWISVIYADGKFLALADSSKTLANSNSRVMSSIDGISWLREDSSFVGRKLIYGNGIFLYVGNNKALISGTLLDAPTFDKSSYKYYPNPSSNIITFEGKNTISNIKLYNLLGQEVLNQNVNSVNPEINISNLPSNTYFAKVTSNGKSETVKIIKN